MWRLLTVSWKSHFDKTVMTISHFYCHGSTTNRHMDQESKYCGNWRQLNIMWRHQNRFCFVAPSELKILSFEAWRSRLILQSSLTTDFKFGKLLSFLTYSPWCNIPFMQLWKSQLIQDISKFLKKLNKITLMLKRHNFTAFSRFIIEVFCNLWKFLFNRPDQLKFVCSGY